MKGLKGLTSIFGGCILLGGWVGTTSIKIFYIIVYELKFSQIKPLLS